MMYWYPSLVSSSMFALLRRPESATTMGLSKPKRPASRQLVAQLPGLTDTRLVQPSLRLALHQLAGIIHRLAVTHQI